METEEKFTNSKDVIAFLAKTFPKCFSEQGDAKPLKIGIFQDLSEQLKDEPRLSKTLLRSSLRHYTNSWRYLHSLKEGAYRIGLDGENDAVIEKEHAEYAQTQLQESKAKVAEKRKENAIKQRAEKKSYKQVADKPKTNKFNGTKPTKSRQTKLPAPEKLTDNHLVVGTEVTVKLGKSPMPATITDVSKDGVQVQLQTGMSVKVQPDSLRLARSKR